MSRDIQNRPVFGELEWNDESDWWEGWIRLPLFAPYDCSATLEREEDEDEELFELRIPQHRESEEPTGPQQAAYSFLINNPELTHDTVIGAIFEHYQKHADWWHQDYDEDEAEELVHRIDSPEGLRPIVVLHHVSIHDTSREGVAPVEFTFGTAWDDEHRLAVVIHQNTVIGIGGDGTGFYDPEEWSEE